MGLEEGRDAEGIAELVEALGLGGYLAPLTEGIAGGVSVGEDDDLVVDQGGQEVGLEGLEASAGEPHEVGEFLTKDNRGFLGFHDCDFLSCFAGKLFRISPRIVQF